MIEVKDSQLRKVKSVSRMDTRASNLQLTFKNLSTCTFNNSEFSGSCKLILFNDAVSWCVDTASVTNEYEVLVE